MKVKDAIAVSSFALLLAQMPAVDVALMVHDADASMHHGAGITASAPPGDALTACLATMASGEWRDTVNCATHGPNDTMSAVTWNCSSSCSPGPTAAAILGGSGPRAVMGSWSGAALDTAHKQLIVWGGGHNDYYGDEVYAFDLTTLNWKILNVPSPEGGTNTTPCGNANSDGTAMSTHTYDSLVWLRSVSKMLVPGEWGCRVTDTATTFLLDPTAQSPSAIGVWVKPGSTNTVGGSFALTSAWDTSRNVAWLNKYGNGSPIYWYDPSNDSYNPLNTFGMRTFHGTGDIDPVHDNFVSTGNCDQGGCATAAALDVFPLTTGIRTTPTPTGPGVAACMSFASPGWQYNPTSGMFMCWRGGQTIYDVDPTTWVSAAQATVSGDTPQCGDSVGSGDGQCSSTTGVQNDGTFKRFNALHAAGYNAELVVNSTNANVYIHKD